MACVATLQTPSPLQQKRPDRRLYGNTVIAGAHDTAGGKKPKISECQEIAGQAKKGYSTSAVPGLPAGIAFVASPLRQLRGQTSVVQVMDGMDGESRTTSMLKTSAPTVTMNVTSLGAAVPAMPSGPRSTCEPTPQQELEGAKNANQYIASAHGLQPSRSASVAIPVCLRQDGQGQQQTVERFKLSTPVPMLHAPVHQEVAKNVCPHAVAESGNGNALLGETSSVRPTRNMLVLAKA